MNTLLAGLRQGDQGIIFTWADGLEAELDPRTLRISCTCARCISETTGERLLDPETVAEEIKLTAFEPVGNYAVRLVFSDGHNSGIYSWDTFYELGENQAELWQEYLDKVARTRSNIIMQRQ